jgi:hypothetical protein
MDFIQTSNKQLDKFGVGKHGFSAGNPGLGVLATYLSNVWCDAVQQELMNVIEAAGLAANAGSLTQLLQAIKLNAAHVGVDIGVANAAAVTFAPAVPALADNMVLWFKAAATNTGATTLNVNGLGVKPVVGGAHSALQGGEIIANGKCLVVWNATLNSFVLIECTGAALQVAAGLQTNQALNLGQFPASIAANGYQRLPSGLIIQWGVQPAASPSGTAVTFPLAFPTAVYGVVGNVAQNNATVTYVVTPSVITTSGFVLNKNFVGASTFGNASEIAYWFAIGK